MRVLGTVDDVNTCDCCGRTNLKATVALQDDEGEVLFYGRICAARAVGWSTKRVDFEINRGNVAIGKARYLFDRWSRYVGADGTIDGATFVINNPGMDGRPRYSPAQAQAMILDVINENGTLLARLHGKAAA